MPRAVTLALLVAGISAASSARANHDAPAGLKLAWRAAEADALPIVLSNRGLVFSNEGEPAGSFALRCSQAYGVSTTAQPNLVRDASDALILQTTRGVSITRDRGCSFTAASGLPDLPLGGFAQAPNAPSRLLVSTEDYEGESRVFASDDFGHTWTPRAANAPSSVFDALAFGADGQRVYASGARYDVKAQQLVSTFAVSRDAGTTFAVRDVPGSPRVLLAAHPRDVDTVFARETASTGISQPHDTMLRSRDGGETFQPVLALTGVITAFSASPDGRTLYLGSEVDGLWRSRDGGDSFTRIAPDDILSVQCLAHHAGALWLCATRQPHGNGIWSTVDDGATLTPRLGFGAVTAQVACAAPTPICDTPWAEFQRELRSEPEISGDAHAAAGPSIINGDASARMPTQSAPAAPDVDARAANESGGCSVATVNVYTRELCWLLALSLLVARRKRPS